MLFKQGFRYSEVFQKILNSLQSRKVNFLSTVRTRCHTVRTLIRQKHHLSTIPSVRMTCHPLRTPDRSASFVRTKCSFRPDPATVSRRFYPACIRLDVSAERPDASQYSISFIFLFKFQEREDHLTVRTMWYPVQTRVSLRQESQFKYHGPDVTQPWSGRAFN
jgi:hypothetical protein